MTTRLFAFVARRRWYMAGALARVVCGGRWLAGSWLLAGTAGILGAQQQPMPARSAPSVPAPTVPAPSVVFRDVTVIDVATGAQRPRQTVVIAGNRIGAIGPTAAVHLPAGAQVVDARGKYLIPGLWDMHVHPLASVDNFYPLLVANGVTGIRDAGSPVPLATLGRWKTEIAAGMRVGPRLFVAGPSVLTCPAPSGAGSGDHTVCVSTPGEARLMVDLLWQAGADFIKTYQLTKELYFAIAAEARRVGLPFGGHVYGMSGLEASDSGARFLDHMTWFDPNVCGEVSDLPDVFDAARCAAAGERLRRNDTWVVGGLVGMAVPRATVFPELYAEEARRFSTAPSQLVAFFKAQQTARDSVDPHAPRRPNSLADWRAAIVSPASPYGPTPWTHDTSSRYKTRRLSHFAGSQGLPILAGTDALPNYWVLPGFVLHDLLAVFVLSGMTPLEALQTATLNPAKAIGAIDSLGTVEAGKVADLVLLDADPLVDIWNTTKIRAVVANGRYFDRVALDRLLAQVEQQVQQAAQRVEQAAHP